MSEFALDLDCPYWFIDGPDVLYCRSCFEDIVLSKAYEDRDGGFASIESDSVCFCEKCGKLLDCDLTEEGAVSELEHFEEYGWSDSQANRFSVYEIHNHRNDDFNRRLKAFLPKSIWGQVANE